MSIPNRFTILLTYNNEWQLYANNVHLTTPEPVTTLNKALDILKVSGQPLANEWTQEQE